LKITLQECGDGLRPCWPPERINGSVSVVDKILGSPLSTDQEEEQRVGVFAGIPMLGLDALSSAAYGPEAALTILLPLGALGLAYIRPIIGVIIVLLLLVYFSYRQTISAYPHGGGSYTVASENLGPRAGALAAAALMLDYILNVAVGISAGVGALVSAVPALQPHTLGVCLAILVAISIVNLRGTRESGLAFALPTYAFVGTLTVVLVAGAFRAIASGGHPLPVTSLPSVPAFAGSVGLWMLLRSFASGCTAMTGVEAVSNGVGAFKQPAVRNAQLTLTAIVAILGVLLFGIAYLAHAYGIVATDPDKPGYQSVLSMLVSAVFGKGPFYFITIGTILSVLALSANTSFADFPRLCRLLALDGLLPHAFANRGRRLVYSHGIAILALLSGLLLIIFGGITDRLIPLFAIGAFLAFTLSQTGMVIHWKRIGKTSSVLPAVVNGLGALATAVALVIVLVAKFRDGAWITTLLVPGSLILFASVKSHYNHIAAEIHCPRTINLDNLVEPIVVVPMKNWNTISEKALRFALLLSKEIRVVHIGTEAASIDTLRNEWDNYVRKPLRDKGYPAPNLEVISSPYRRLFNPLLDYINKLQKEHPDRKIAVIIPELVEARWYHYLLHNQRATGLKAALLWRGERRVVVINVPWYATERSHDRATGGDCA
jgi:amino acid transporter